MELCDNLLIYISKQLYLINMNTIYKNGSSSCSGCLVVIGLFLYIINEPEQSLELGILLLKILGIYLCLIAIRFFFEYRKRIYKEYGFDILFLIFIIVFIALLIWEVWLKPDRY